MQTDPNLADYRYEPATGHIVLLDFGAVQFVALDLAVDFRSLLRVAKNLGATDPRAAMLRIEFFGQSTAPHQQYVSQSLFYVAMAPLRQAEPFDCGRSDRLVRLRDMGLVIGQERELSSAPPPATLVLHRKIGG